MIPQASGQRRGVSLIETVIVVSLSAILTGLAIAGMTALYGYNRATNAKSHRQAAIQQMRASLREDIHRAIRAAWDADGDTLELLLSDGSSTELQLQAGRWVRTERSGEVRAVATSFGVSSRYGCECDQSQVAAGDVLRLHFVTKSADALPKETQTERTHRFDLVAVVGRDALLVRE